jgi:hypothetical protein
LQLHPPGDHARHRQTAAQLFEEIRREGHGSCWLSAVSDQPSAISFTRMLADMSCNCSVDCQDQEEPADS